jgi:hypothetical protein
MIIDFINNDQSSASASASASSFIDQVSSTYTNLTLFSFVTITWITSIGALTLLLTPILAVFCLIIGLASSGSSFGIRKMYVKALLKIFEVKTFLF